MSEPVPITPDSPAALINRELSWLSFARYFADSVEPILVPLAVDAVHPFPFISNLGLNLAVQVTEPGRRNRRFVRIKVPANRPRWVPLPDHAGWVPLEQVIACNLGALFPRAVESACFFFRVTRGAKDDPWRDQAGDEDADLSPGAIIGMVTAELTARKYAGVVRLEVRLTCQRGCGAGSRLSSTPTLPTLSRLPDC